MDNDKKAAKNSKPGQKHSEEEIHELLKSTKFKQELLTEHEMNEMLIRIMCTGVKREDTD